MLCRCLLEASKKLVLTFLPKNWTQIFENTASFMFRGVCRRATRSTWQMSAVISASDTCKKPRCLHRACRECREWDRQKLQYGRASFSLGFISRLKLDRIPRSIKNRCSLDNVARTTAKSSLRHKRVRVKRPREFSWNWTWSALLQNHFPCL